MRDTSGAVALYKMGADQRICNSWLCFSTCHSSWGSSLKPKVSLSSRAAFKSLILNLFPDRTSCFGSISSCTSCINVDRRRIFWSAPVVTEASVILPVRGQCVAKGRAPLKKAAPAVAHSPWPGGANIAKTAPVTRFI